MGKRQWQIYIGQRTIENEQKLKKSWPYIEHLTNNYESINQCLLNEYWFCPEQSSKELQTIIEQLFTGFTIIIQQISIFYPMIFQH